MTTEVATQNAENGLVIQGLTNLVTFKTGEQSFGAGAAINSGIFDDDILVGKVRLKQQMSTDFPEVTPGNFVDSLTGRNFGNSVKFIVVDSFKMWRVFDAGNDDYISSEIFTLENAMLPYEDTIEGRKVIRRQGLYMSVLLGDDMKAGKETPMTIDFWKSSKGAGKQLITFLKELELSGAPSSAVVFEMTANEEQFEKGKAFVKQIKPIVATPAQFVEMSARVYRDLKKNADAIKIDESDVIDSTVKHAEKPVEMENDIFNQ